MASSTAFTPGARSLLPAIRSLHDHLRGAVLEATEAHATGELAQVHADAEGDTIYAVDRVSEEALVAFVDREIARHTPVVLIAEGLPGGLVTLPEGTDEADARWRIIVDPIDGTRGLMYQKRSAWILTGVAPNCGAETSLRDIALAVQTEIPLVRQHLSDAAWAIRGEGARAERYNRLTGERKPLTLRPSTASTIAHGFATVSRFFPGARGELAAIDDEIAHAALGPVRPGKAQLFEDQYIATGGQLYELMAGRDRFIADLRPLMEVILARRGQALGICAHPYDLCTELIARELGVIVTNPWGEPLDTPLDVHADVGWVGYANEAIRREVEPHLHHALQRRALHAP